MLAQIVFVALVSAALVLATDALGYRSPVNVLWMFALPVLLGLALNNGPRRRALAAVALLAVSLLTTVVIGVNFTSYG